MHIHIQATQRQQETTMKQQSTINNKANIKNINNKAALGTMEDQDQNKHTL